MWGPLRPDAKFACVDSWGSIVPLSQVMAVNVEIAVVLAGLAGAVALLLPPVTADVAWSRAKGDE